MGFRVWVWAPAISMAGLRRKAGGGRPARRWWQARDGEAGGSGTAGRAVEEAGWARPGRGRRRREGQAEEPRAREGLTGAPRLGKQGGGGGVGAEEGGGRRLKMNSARKIHHRQMFIRW